MADFESESLCIKEESGKIFRITSTYHVYMYPDTPFHRYRELFEIERKESGGELTATQFNMNFMNGSYPQKPSDSEKDWFYEQMRMYTSKRFSLISPIIRTNNYPKIMSDAEMDRREYFLRRSERLAKKKETKEH